VGTTEGELLLASPSERKESHDRGIKKQGQGRGERSKLLSLTVKKKAPPYPKVTAEAGLDPVRPQRKGTGGKKKQRVTVLYY